MTRLTSRFRWLIAGATAVLLAALAGLAWWADLVDPQSLLNSLRTVWAAQAFSTGTYGQILLQVVVASLALGFLWFVTKRLSRVVRRRLLDRTDLGEGHKFALQRFLAYLVFTFGALIALDTLGLDLGSLALFSGGLGIGLGLGFQAIAKDFASGLILLLEHPVKVGDRVEVGTLQGTILSIGARATSVRTNDNIVIVVPNSEFIEGRVTNLTLNDRNVRMNVPFGVSYGSDPEHVRSIGLAVARDNPDVLETPRPDVIFAGFGDSSLDFKLRAWTARRVATPQAIVSDIYYSLFAALKAEGIEIPFPQRDLHFKSVAKGMAPVAVEQGYRAGKQDAQWTDLGSSVGR